MKEVVFNADQSFIGAWFIDDDSLCDDIISWFEKHEGKHPGYITKDKERVVDEGWKRSTDLTCDPLDPMSQRYEQELQKVVDKYIEKYPMCNETAKWTVEDFNVQKYEPGGGFYNWHSERTSSGIVANRHLAFMTYLNDVDDAGETEFWHQKLKIKPKKGLTLIWPADWTHYHRGIPSPTCIKYIVTGWFAFIAE